MPDWSVAAKDLEAIYQRYYPQAVARAVEDASSDFGQRITVPPKDLERVTAQIAVRVKGVTDTMKERIATAVNTHEGNPESLVKALQEMLDSSEGSARRLADTETASVYNQGVALAAQNADGKVGVRIADGDGDSDCADVDGLLASPDWFEANPLAHPNCSRQGSLESMADDDSYDLE